LRGSEPQCFVFLPLLRNLSRPRVTQKVKCTAAAIAPAAAVSAAAGKEEEEEEEVEGEGKEEGVPSGTS
jgi:hypothetical protein